MGGGGQSPEEQARSHQESLAKYTDVSTALDDGYTMTTPYVRTDQGVLGLPFVNLQVPELDPEQPPVLFYDLREDGTYALLGAEWLVSTESVDSPPSMFGRELDGPHAGETEFLPSHYGLHVWLFEDNPAGLFAPYHEGVSPPSYIADLEAAWGSLNDYFASETNARDAGYANTEKCIATSEGGYGVPFVNMENEGADPQNPAVLLYRLSTSWTYTLQGAEWYVPVSETSSAPSMFDRKFHGPIDGHSSEADQPRHYGLHVWLYTANPNGMFARYNPRIRC